MPYRLIRDQWFLVGILLVTAITLIDWNAIPVSFGKYLRSNHGNEIGIVLIFILSGLELQSSHLFEASKDWKALLLTVLTIFTIAPLLAWGLSFLSTSEQIKTGLFLISIVPTSLASGVVMAGAVGGSVALALLTTIIANALSVLIIPGYLQFFAHAGISVPTSKIGFNLFVLVVIPLLAGMVLQKIFASGIHKIPFRLNILSRLIVLGLMFMGIAEGRKSILGNGARVFEALILVVLLHLLLCAILWIILKSLRWDRSRSMSVFFMGIQKTLPLSVWLQSTLYPTFGLALTVCVFYHIVQLTVDSYWVSRLKRFSL
jgi:solute carrier family 10 (sodium/bile acid cotransporter), member 7